MQHEHHPYPDIVVFCVSRTIIRFPQHMQNGLDRICRIILGAALQATGGGLTCSVVPETDVANRFGPFFMASIILAPFGNVFRDPMLPGARNSTTERICDAKSQARSPEWSTGFRVPTA